MSKQYDLIAIGGGSGGLSVAERAAEYGARCAVIEKGLIGGTCVNVGCVPKKVMWYASDMAYALKNAADYGFDISLNGFHWQKLIKGRQGYISGINNWYHDYLKENKIDEITGSASFVDANTLDVNGETYSAPHIVIAPGSTPIIPRYLVGILVSPLMVFLHCMSNPVKSPLWVPVILQSNSPGC